VDDDVKITARKNMKNRM